MAPLLPGPILGVTAGSQADRSVLTDAGVGALRCGLVWPWTDGVDGELSPRWKEGLRRLGQLAGAGFTIVGGTPILGSLVRRADPSGGMRTVWKSRTPDWMGTPGTKEFAERYRAVCRFFGRELRRLVPMYQILNELDIPIFAGPLNPRQACELVEAGAAGLREGDPDAVLGTNTAKSPMSYYLYGRLYKDDLLDYCGVDGYLGTWEPGRPEQWRDIVEELHALTDRPVFVNEWGYSSAGQVMTDAQAADDPWPCEHRKWRHSWAGGHTPEVQAEFVRRAMDAFASCGETFLGCLFYRWEDQARCWQCGRED